MGPETLTERPEAIHRPPEKGRPGRGWRAQHLQSTVTRRCTSPVTTRAFSSRGGVPRHSCGTPGWDQSPPARPRPLPLHGKGASVRGAGVLVRVAPLDLLARLALPAPAAPQDGEAVPRRRVLLRQARVSSMSPPAPWERRPFPLVRGTGSGHPPVLGSFLREGPAHSVRSHRLSLDRHTFLKGLATRRLEKPQSTRPAVKDLGAEDLGDQRGCGS